MTIDEIKDRVAELLPSADGTARGAAAFELFNGTLSLMIALYGSNSLQVNSYVHDAEQVREKMPGAYVSAHIATLASGALRNLAAEVESGFIGSLQKSITAEVLTDHIKLSRHILQESSNEDSKNVAAVLAAAAFEDTIRRLANNNGISHTDKLADVLDQLKTRGVLRGAQVGIANSYLNFRNSALHAQWDRVDTAGVASILGFVEQLLLTLF